MQKMLKIIFCVSRKINDLPGRPVTGEWKLAGRKEVQMADMGRRQVCSQIWKEIQVETNKAEHMRFAKNNRK